MKNIHKIKTKYQIKVMQAFIDDKPIQFRSANEKSTIVWGQASFPSWDWLTYEFRIKPNDKEYIIQLEKHIVGLEAQL